MLWLMLACGPQPPATPTPLEVEVMGSPVLSGCLETAPVTLSVRMDADHRGLPATFESGGQVLWEGVTAEAFEMTFAWPVGRGDVAGRFVVERESVATFVPVEVVPGVAPRLELGFTEAQLDQSAVDAAAAAGPWSDGVDVASFPTLVGTFDATHQQLGAVVEAAAQRCPANGDTCVALPVELGTGQVTVSLDAVAASRCMDPSDGSRDLFVVTVRDGCGSSTEQLLARVVHDDCDGDGVFAAEDCDDEVGGVAAIGDIAVDGSPAIEVPEEGGDVVLCGGAYPDPLVFTGDVSLRAVGEAAQLGPVVVLGGHARFETVSLDGEPALDATDAVSLVLVDVDLDGSLLGPRNGALEAMGGRWTGGTTIEGGAARLSGGALTRVEVIGGSAQRGGGIWTDGDLVLTNVDLLGGEGVEGGALYVDHANATITGARFDGARASRGGAIAAVLDPGQVLELRPSTIDLEPTRLHDVSAPDGAAVRQVGGALRTVLVDGVGWESERGGLQLQAVAWTESGSTYADIHGQRGALALSRGGSAGLQSSAVSGSAPQGFVALEDDAEVVWQASMVSGSGCGAWIEAGMLTSSQITGVVTVGEVCTADFTAPFGTSCTAAGCD